jgi:hypothetical protein
MPNMLTIAGGIILGVLGLLALFGVAGIVLDVLNEPRRRREAKEMGQCAREQRREEELLREMTAEESANYRTWRSVHGRTGPDSKRLPSLSPAAQEMERIDAERSQRALARGR